MSQLSQNESLMLEYECKNVARKKLNWNRSLFLKDEYNRNPLADLDQRYQGAYLASVLQMNLHELSNVRCLA